MIFHTTQKIIQIGSSKGVILPAKELKKLDLAADQEVEITVRSPRDQASNDEVMKAATSLLDRYHQDFKNLAER